MNGAPMNGAPMQSKRLALAGITAVLTAMTLLAGGFAFNGALTLALLSIVLGGAWLFGWRRAMQLALDWGLAGAVGLAAGAAIIASPWLALPALIAALLAWDLLRFDLQLRAFSRVDDLARIERHHIQRAALTLAAGLLPTMVALLVRAQFSFAIIALLAVIAVLALARAAGALSTAADDSSS
jgi:hypothetical protein